MDDDMQGALGGVYSKSSCWPSVNFDFADPMTDYRSIPEQMDTIPDKTKVLTPRLKGLMLVPRAAFFVENPDLGVLECELPLLNLTQKRIMYRIHCTSNVMSLPDPVGTIGPNETVLVKCFSKTGVNVTNKDLIYGSFQVQAHPFPDKNSRTKAAIGRYWTRMSRSTKIEGYEIRKLEIPFPQPGFPDLETPYFELALHPPVVVKDESGDDEFSAANWEAAEQDFRVMGEGLNRYNAVLKKACNRFQEMKGVDSASAPASVPQTPVYIYTTIVGYIGIPLIFVAFYFMNKYMRT